ncbi:MAG: hypothetical protein HYT87_18610 [Nitrospirae bacterium]|nr:hypothetical protein [Nitrospirota bacterium]
MRDPEGKPVDSQPLAPGASTTTFDFLNTLGHRLPEGLLDVTVTLADRAEPHGNTRSVSDRFIVDLSGPIVSPTPEHQASMPNRNGRENPVPAQLVVHAVDVPRLPIGHAGVRSETLTLNLRHAESARAYTYTALPQFQDAPVIVYPFTPGPAGDFVATLLESQRNETQYPDGHYTWTTTVRDRLLNTTTSTFNFCLDRAAPTLTNFNIGSPIDYPAYSLLFIPSLQPIVTYNCEDRFPTSPSCGMAKLEVVATRTHTAPIFGSDDPVAIPSSQLTPVRIEIEPTLCDGLDHSFQFTQSLGQEGIWTFDLEALDKAQNKTVLPAGNSYYLDVTPPFTLPDGLLLLHAGEGLQPVSTVGLPTNDSRLRLGVWYTNGFSGVNPATVVFSNSGSSAGCTGALALLSAGSHSALSKDFLPCEGTNTASVFLRDKAGNPFTDSITYTTDYTPPALTDMTMTSISICVSWNALGGCTASAPGERFSAHATDNLSGVHKVELLLGSTRKAFVRLGGAAGDDYSIDIFQTEYDAASDVRIQAWDKAANMAEARQIGPAGGTVSTRNGGIQLAIPAGSTSSKTFIGVTSVSENQLAEILGYNPFDEATAGSHLTLLNYEGMTLSGDPGTTFSLPPNSTIGCKKDNAPQGEQMFMVDFLEPNHRYDNEGRVRVLAGVKLDEFDYSGGNTYYKPLDISDCPGLSEIHHAVACVSLSTDHGKTQLVHGQVRTSGAEIKGQVVVVDSKETTYADFTKPRLDSERLQPPSRRVWGSAKHFGIQGTADANGLAKYCIPTPAENDTKAYAAGDTGAFFKDNGIGLDRVRIAIGTDGCDVTVPVTPPNPGNVIAAGTCEAKYIEAGGACENVPIVPPSVNGGPPDSLNLASETYGDPQFAISGRNGIAGITVHVDLRGKVPSPPGSKLDLFVRNATSTGKIPDTFTNDTGRQFYVFHPLDVAGFSAGAIAMDNPKLYFNTRLRRDLFAPNACRVFGRMATQKIIPAELPSQTETYANVFGGVEGPSTFSGFSDEDERCTPSPPKSVPASNVCYSALEQGCRKGIADWRPWEDFYANADPNTCRPSIRQHKLMLMKRAGINTVRIDVPWGIVQEFSAPVYNFEKQRYHLDAYMTMAGAYNMEIEADFGGWPWWGSSCCISGDTEETCVRRTARLTACGTDCEVDPALIEEPHKKCCADKKRAQDPACDFACLQNELDSRGWLRTGQCVPGGVTSLNPEVQPDYAMFKNFVRATVEEFAPGGKLAQRHPNLPGIGIRNWGLGNEIENPRNFLRIRPDPASVNDKDHPGLQSYVGLKEYKQLIKQLHDLIRVELNHPDHRIHGGGPNVTARISQDCDYYGDEVSKDRRPNGHIEMADLAERCHEQVSIEHIYQVFRDPRVEGYSLNDPTFDGGVVVNFHWYQEEGPNPNANERGGRQRQADVLRTLTCMFPNRPIWSNEGGICDQEWALARLAEDPGADLRECIPQFNPAPSALAQAGYLVGVSSYLGPRYWPGDCSKVYGTFTCTSQAGFEGPCPCPVEKTCEGLTDLPTTGVSGNFEKLFWYRPADGGGGLFGLGESAGEPATLTLRPVYHAISPVSDVPILFGVEMPFRTGIDRKYARARANFSAFLKAGQRVAVTATGKNLSTGLENRNLGFGTFVENSAGETVGVIWHKENDPELYPHINEGTFQAFSDGTYTFVIIPHKLYVPTELETSDSVNHPDILLTPENTLSLLEDPDKDGIRTLKTADQRTKVLRAAEGAYVEGVIRFTLIGTSGAPPRVAWAP